MLRVQEREWETTFGLVVGRIWAGCLGEVVLELSLKSRKDWCRRDGGEILRVTRAWEYTRLPWGGRRIWKSRWSESPKRPGDRVWPLFQEPYLCACI